MAVKATAAQKAKSLRRAKQSKIERGIKKSFPECKGTYPECINYNTSAIEEDDFDIDEYLITCPECKNCPWFENVKKAFRATKEDEDQ